MISLERLRQPSARLWAGENCVAASRGALVSSPVSSPIPTALCRRFDIFHAFASILWLDRIQACVFPISGAMCPLRLSRSATLPTALAPSGYLNWKSPEKRLILACLSSGLPPSTAALICCTSRWPLGASRRRHGSGKAILVSRSADYWMMVRSNTAPHSLVVPYRVYEALLFTRGGPFLCRIPPARVP